ncbi:MAG TPA: glycosyltransferase [Gemmatimonadaceae bacterium]|nr:glycosyltransferase [Gemmatimonadaceae bacterium]
MAGTQPPAAQDPRAEVTLEQTLFPATPPPALDLRSAPLPPRVRPDARLGVLDITEFFGETTGGIRTYLLEKAKYVEASPSLRHVLVVPGPADSVTQSDGVRCYRLRGQPVPTQHPYRFMSGLRANTRIFAHERPDVIEVGSTGVVPWLVNRAARGTNIPVVCFFHSDFPNIIAPHHKTGAGWSAARELAYGYLRMLDRFFVTTLVASDFSASELRRVGVENTVRVPMGVDLERFHPRRKAHAEATRRDASLPEGPLAAYVGRFAREKDLHVLVDAWSIVEQSSDATLLMIGDGPLRPELQARAKSKRIRWIPFEKNRERLADLVAALDFYIAPGPVETFGLAAVEALASGIPVLSCDRGAVAEHVQRSGGGRLFVTGSAGSLAEEVVEMTRADLPGLGANARAHAEKEHSWSGTFDRLFKVYADLAK